MAAEKSTEQRVKEIIVEQLGVNADQVTPEAKFIEDLGADSAVHFGLNTVLLLGVAADLLTRQIFCSGLWRSPAAKPAAGHV